MEPVISMMFLFLSSIILSPCVLNLVLRDLHCESEVFHAQLVCVPSVESISTTNPECLAVAVLSMPAVSVISAHSPRVPKGKSKKKDL